MMNLNQIFTKVVQDFATAPALMAGTHVFQGIRCKDGQLVRVSDEEAKVSGAKIYIVNEAGVWRVSKHGKPVPVNARPAIQLSFAVAAGARCTRHHYFPNWDD